MEELHLNLARDELTPIGTFTDIAANEPGHTLVDNMYRAEIIPEKVRCAAEIEDIYWFPPSESQNTYLAPLTANKTIPIV